MPDPKDLKPGESATDTTKKNADGSVEQKHEETKPGTPETKVSETKVSPPAQPAPEQK